MTYDEIQVLYKKLVTLKKEDKKFDLKYILKFEGIDKDNTRYFICPKYWDFKRNIPLSLTDFTEEEIINYNKRIKLNSNTEISTLKQKIGENIDTQSKQIYVDIKKDRDIKILYPKLIKSNLFPCCNEMKADKTFTNIDELKDDNKNKLQAYNKIKRIGYLNIIELLSNYDLFKDDNGLINEEIEKKYMSILWENQDEKNKLQNVNQSNENTIPTITNTNSIDSTFRPQTNLQSSTNKLKQNKNVIDSRPKSVMITDRKSNVYIKDYTESFRVGLLDGDHKGKLPNIIRKFFNLDDKCNTITKISDFKKNNRIKNNTGVNKLSKSNTLITNYPEFCLLRYGLKQNTEKTSFLSLITLLYNKFRVIYDNIYSNNQKLFLLNKDEELSNEQMIDIIIDAIDLDRYVKYLNGSIIDMFYDENTKIDIDTIINNTENNDNIIKTEIFKSMINEPNKESSRYMLFKKIIISFELFKEYLRDINEIKDYYILWDIISDRNPKLFRSGINICMIELLSDSTQEKISLVCPLIQSSVNLYEPSKQTIFILKNNMLFEPLFGYSHGIEYVTFDENDIQKYDSFKHVFDNIKLYSNAYKQCKHNEINNIEYNKHYVMSIGLEETRKIIKEINDKFKQNSVKKENIIEILYQFVNNDGRVIGLIVLFNSNKKIFMIPVKPSSIVFDLELYINDTDDNDIIFEQNYEDTKQFLEYVYKVSINKIPIQPVFKAEDDGNIIGFITKSNNFIPIDDENIEPNYDEELPSRNMFDIYKYDHYLNKYGIENKNVVDEVKKIKLENQFFFSFRNTFKYLLHKKDNLIKKSEIEIVINNNEFDYNTKLDILMDYIKVLMKDYVSFVTMESDKLIKINDLNVCYDNDIDTCKSNNSYCLTESIQSEEDSDGFICKLLLPKESLISTNNDNEIIYYKRVADDILRNGIYKHFYFDTNHHIFNEKNKLKVNKNKNEIIIFNNNWKDFIEFLNSNHEYIDSKYTNRLSSDVYIPVIDKKILLRDYSEKYKPHMDHEGYYDDVDLRTNYSIDKPKGIPLTTRNFKNTENTSDISEINKKLETIKENNNNEINNNNNEINNNNNEINNNNNEQKYGDLQLTKKEIETMSEEEKKIYISKLPYNQKRDFKNIYEEEGKYDDSSDQEDNTTSNQKDNDEEQNVEEEQKDNDEEQKDNDEEQNVEEEQKDNDEEQKDNDEEQNVEEEQKDNDEEQKDNDEEQNVEEEQKDNDEEEQDDENYVSSDEEKNIDIDEYENNNIKDKMIDERDCLNTLYTSHVGKYKNYFNKYEKKKNKIFNNNYYSEKRYYKNVYINDNDNQNETLLKSLLNCNNYVIIRDILINFNKTEEEKNRLDDIIRESGIKFRTNDIDFNITNSIDIFKIHIQDILVHMYKLICDNEDKKIEYTRYLFVVYCLSKQGKPNIFNKKFKKNDKQSLLNKEIDTFNGKNIDQQNILNDKLKNDLFSKILENKNNSYFLSNLDIHLLSEFFKIPILIINTSTPTPDYKDILNIQHDTYNIDNPSVWINTSDKFINYFDNGSKKEDDVKFCVITETAYPENSGSSIKKFINYKLVFKTPNLTNVNIKDDIIKSIKNNTISCKLSLHELNRELFHEYIKKHIYKYDNTNNNINNNINNNSNLLNVYTYIHNNKQINIKSYYGYIKLIPYTFKPGKGKKDITTRTYIYPEKILKNHTPDIIQNENRTNPFQPKPSNIIAKTKRKFKQTKLKANNIINKTIKKINNNKTNEFQITKQRIIANSNNIQNENINVKTPINEPKKEQSLKETNNKSVKSNPFQKNKLPIQKQINEPKKEQSLKETNNKSVKSNPFQKNKLPIQKQINEPKKEQSLKEPINKSEIKRRQNITRDNKLLNKFAKYTKRNKQSTDMSNDSSKKPKIKIGSLIKRNNKKE